MRDLSTRFGSEIAKLIMSGSIHQGMTEEMVIESWGRPADIDKEVLKTKTRQTWKYNQMGTNRFRDRVLFEDGIVVGWKNQ